MLRFTLAARIAVIVFVSLTAVWIVAIAAFYRSQSDRGDSVRPPPARIAAIVALLEAAPPAQRRQILAALTTEDFRPRLTPTASTSSAPGGQPVAEDILRPYAAALGGRPFSLTAQPDSLLTRWAPRLIPPASNALTFAIGLRRDDRQPGPTLTIETQSPYVVNRLGLPVGFGAGLLGTLIAIGALLIMQRETKPLARLAAAVDQMNLSSDPAPLPDARGSAPEIRAVTNAFKRLQDRLGGMMRARLAMVGGISHDVRTYATRLRLRVERIPDDAERSRAIADIDDMIRLLDDALLASRSAAGEHSQELVEFAALVNGEVDDRRGQGAAVEIVCSKDAEQCAVLGDRLALRRTVSNLIDNALKYGYAAHLTLTVQGLSVVLKVDDEGPGIPPDECDAMFEPFSRLEESRNRATGGAGLGLAIVRTLAEAHGGAVEIGDAPSGGARVALTLPIFKAQHR